MELEGKFLQRVGEWESMSRWERSELGRDLRRLGLSYGEIMELIPVKKSTLATWCREMKLTEEQIAAIKERRAPEPGIPRNTNRRRLEEIAQLRAIAREEAQTLIHDPVVDRRTRSLLGGRFQGPESAQHGRYRSESLEALR
jgi:hypothetical protein